MSNVTPIKPRIPESATAAHRILIGDFAPVKFDALAKWLRRENVTCDKVTDAQAFLEKVQAEKYDVCLVNLLLGGGGMKLIAETKKLSNNPKLRIVVFSKQVQRVNIENAIKAGADDFLAEPFENESLYNRILYHLAPKTIVDTRGYKAALKDEQHKVFIRLLLDTIEQLSCTDHQAIHKSVLEILEDTAQLLGSNRTSVINVDKETGNGFVLASSDDPKFRDYPISLNKYPEVMHVVNTGSIVLVDDISQNYLTSKIKDSVKSISIGSIMVFPVRFQSDVVGALVIRRPQAKELPPMEILSILQAIANVLAAHANMKILLRKIYSDFGRKA